MIKMRKRYASFAVVVGLVMVGVGSAEEPELEFSPVSGKVTVDGEPLAGGRIFFHLKEGQFVGCRTKANGAYAIDRLPVGEYPVTIEGTFGGKPLPERYSSDEEPVLHVTIIAGENVLEFNVTSR